MKTCLPTAILPNYASTSRSLRNLFSFLYTWLLLFELPPKGTYSNDSLPSREITIMPGRVKGLRKSRITYPVISSVAGVKRALLGITLRS